MDELGFGITLALKDLFTSNAGKIERAYKSLDGTIASSSEGINRNLERIKQGAMLVGVGLAIMSIPSALIASTMDVQKALGQMRSLGVKDLEGLALAGREFSNQWAGTTTAEFIAASSHIKQGIHGLSDTAVAEYTGLAALTAKATRSTVDEMTSLFATGYRIYRGLYSQMSDKAFGEMLSGGISAAVRNYKTSGSAMAEAISNLGVTAANQNIPLQEQLAILGMLQSTMSAGEAGSRYKIFLKFAAQAGEDLGMSFQDAQGNALGLVGIISKLKERYGETLSFMEKNELQKAFGKRGGMEVIDFFYNRMGELSSGIEQMNNAPRTGTALTLEMAQAMNMDMGSQLTLVRQQVHNLFETLGTALLPIVSPVMLGVSNIILTLQKLADRFPGLTRVVLGSALAIGGLLVVGGLLLMSLGAIGMAIPAANVALATLGFTATITGATIKAALISAFWPVLIGIAIIYALKKVWDNNLGGIQNKVAAFWHTVTTVWEGINSLISSGKISEALRNELQNMGLWDFVKSVYMVAYRIGQFLSGIWQSVKSSLDMAGEAFYPVFSSIYMILVPIGKLLFTIAQALGLVGASVPSNAFMTFGKVLGWLISSPLRVLAWTLKILWTPVSLLAKAISWILDLVASIPAALLPKNLANFQKQLATGFNPLPKGKQEDFQSRFTPVLPKGMEGLQKRLAAGSLALTMAATPVVAAEKPNYLAQAQPPILRNIYYQNSNYQETESRTVIQSERREQDNLRQAQLLADKNTYYYQTVNNQRTGNTQVAPVPAAPPDQRPLEVNLHLDGREIYRAVVRQEREQGVRSNG